MALDLPLPKQVFGHGWLIIDGGKISKSKGNYKDPREYIDKYGVDAIRYFALREVPFGSDGNFSEEALISRTNSDLANTLGNLVNRTISMTNKYFHGTVTNKNSYSEDEQFINAVSSLKDKVAKKMKTYEVGGALSEIFEVLRKSNKYIDDTTPWILYKDNNLERLETVLYNLLEAIRICTILLIPFIPSTTERIFKQIGTSDNSYSSIEKFGYFSLFKVNAPSVLFERIVEK